MRELLSQYQFDGDNIRIVRGSALAAVSGSDEVLGRDAIMELMEAVESEILTPEREVDKVRHHILFAFGMRCHHLLALTLLHVRAAYAHTVASRPPSRRCSCR